MPAAPASARRSAAAGCDPRSGSGTGRANLRWCGVRRVRGLRPGADRRLSETAAGSQGRRSRATRAGSLHDYGLTSLDLDLTDACRQCKRIVEADARGFVPALRVVADDFLQQDLRNRHAADGGGLELES